VIEGESYEGVGWWEGKGNWEGESDRIINPKT